MHKRDVIEFRLQFIIEAKKTIEPLWSIFSNLDTLYDNYIHAEVLLSVQFSRSVVTINLIFKMQFRIVVELIISIS